MRLVFRIDTAIGVVCASVEGKRGLQNVSTANNGEDYNRQKVVTFILK